VGLGVAVASIIVAGVLGALDTIESETQVTGILTGIYQPQDIDSDVPRPVRLLVRLDRTAERIEIVLSEPVAFRPGKRVMLTERSTKFGRKLYRFERYLDPEEERRLLRDHWPQ
jgi:hypothetical protein